MFLIISTARLTWLLLLYDLIMIRCLLVDLLSDDELTDFVRQRFLVSLTIDLIILIVLGNLNTSFVLFDAFGLAFLV